MVERDYDLKERGQNYALISVVLLLAFGGLLIFVGEYEWAARVAIFAIAGIVGIFVTGKWADIKSAKTPKEGEEP